MSSGAPQKVLGVCLTVAILAIGSLLVLQQYVRWSARRAATGAQRAFGGDPVEALIKRVGCEECDLAARSEAVWALGVIGDRRALPVLRKYHTGEPCRHGVVLCQYELDKAIRKIEGTWGWRASLRLDRSDPSPDH